MLAELLSKRLKILPVVEAKRILAAFAFAVCFFHSGMFNVLSQCSEAEETFHCSELISFIYQNTVPLLISCVALSIFVWKYF